MEHQAGLASHTKSRLYTSTLQIGKLIKSYQPEFLIGLGDSLHARPRCGPVLSRQAPIILQRRAPVRFKWIT